MSSRQHAWQRFGALLDKTMEALSRLSPLGQHSVIACPRLRLELLELAQKASQKIAKMEHVRAELRKVRNSQERREVSEKLARMVDDNWQEEIENAYQDVMRRAVAGERSRRGRGRRPKIHRPSGFKLLAIAEFSCKRKTYAKVFEPIIRDLQDEHNEALAANRLWKARYVRMRGYCAFWSAVWAQMSSSLVKFVLKAINVATSNPV